ncbi:MAG: 50S ribosomal protein L15 [Acidobacteria bacterium]|nr:MAG: 50S ribosomal protein L15 [Acidobacteriota bacterium]PIE89998.1 MAG: 50S ribosomal protein L15 [Acidobacteriota bacterium]
MKLNELRPNAGATKKRKRVGRGPGSGLGKTSGRGENGQKSRSGYSRKRHFEGGQMPLQRRIPKVGFTNIFRKEYVVLNVRNLATFNVDEVKLEDYKNFGFAKNMKDGIKILGFGELDKPMTVHAHKFSKTAQEKIEKAGGKCIVCK